MDKTYHEPLRLPVDRDERIRRALEADDGWISAAGLPSKLGFLEVGATPTEQSAQLPGVATPGLVALARLVQLARREQRMSREDFATRLGLDLQEVVEMELACVVPELRLLHSLSVRLNVSYEKLQTLAGYRTTRDESLQRETLKFAASSGPMDRLSTEEARALHDFIRALDD